MSDEKTRKEEWEETGRDIEAKIRKELASWASAEETDDWQTIGQRMESKIRGEIAATVGADPVRKRQMGWRRA